MMQPSAKSAIHRQTDVHRRNKRRAATRRRAGVPRKSKRREGDAVAGTFGRLGVSYSVSEERGLYGV